MKRIAESTDMSEDEKIKAEEQAKETFKMAS
jgi:hypothetical protein